MTPNAIDAIIELKTVLTQTFESGGVHVRPDMRLLLHALASSVNPKFIIETGYDAGVTTEALALTGAAVLAVDDFSEYAPSKALAAERLKHYPNVILRNMDALEALKAQPDNTVCFLFVDDSHKRIHVMAEAEEARRILRPGGIVAFHDTVYHHLWYIVDQAFDETWQRINLPAFALTERIKSTNFGLGIFKKP